MGPKDRRKPAGYHTPENQHDNRKPTIWRCISYQNWWLFRCHVSFPGGVQKSIDTLTGSSSLGWVSSTHKAFHCAKFSAICVDTSAVKKIWELLSRLSRWWLNQAIWKIWSSKWLSSPRFWVKIKKMKSPPSYVYNYPEKNEHGILEKKSWFGKEKHLQTISFGVRCFFFSGRKCSKMSGFKYMASHK